MPSPHLRPQGPIQCNHSRAARPRPTNVTGDQPGPVPTAKWSCDPIANSAAVPAKPRGKALYQYQRHHPAASRRPTYPHQVAPPLATAPLLTNNHQAAPPLATASTFTYYVQSALPRATAPPCSHSGIPTLDQQAAPPPATAPPRTTTKTTHLGKTCKQARQTTDRGHYIDVPSPGRAATRHGLTINQRRRRSYYPIHPP